ncbi:MAG: TIGR02757 family protein [Treponema sp.]|nr:TIGR02757 family protein [Treponema sp.]
MNFKTKLDNWYNKICTPDFIPSDPVQFPRRYAKREDIEIAAFLSATIAWGRRDMILRSCEKMFALTGKSPFNFIMQGDFKKLKDKNIHRTFFENDLKYFCKGFNHIYAKYGSIEKLFSQCFSGDALNVWEGFSLLREEFAKANKYCYSKHISNPFTSRSREMDSSGSACKRLNLALRWLVRKGPVDLGLWKSVKTSALFIPLDVHVARTARNLNLLERKSNDKRAVIELTEKLREFCADDPVKYDFALFGMGVTG